MGRQLFSKYFPTRYPSPGIVFEQSEVDGDDPAVNPDGRSERVGGSFVDVQLDDAQILGLAGANITLVAAPGANRAIVVDAVFFFLNVVDGAYDDAAADGNLNLKYAAGGDAGAGFNIEADAFIDEAADAARFYGHPYDYPGTAAIVVTPVANTAVVLDNDGAEYTTAGNDTAANTLSIRVYYHIVDTAIFT